MNKMYEELLPVEVLAAGSPIATTANLDTSRLSFDKFRKIMFYLTIDADDRDAWIDDQILTLSLREADAFTAGTTAEVVGDIDIVGGQNMLECELWVEGHADDDYVEVNGVTFTRHNTGYHAVDRPLIWETPAELVTAINAADLGVTASGVAAVHDVYLTVNDPGTMTINVDLSIVAATGQLATMKVAAIVEAYYSQISDEYIYLNIDNNHATTALDGDVEAYCVAVKGSPYHSPVKQVTAIVG